MEYHEIKININILGVTFDNVNDIRIKIKYYEDEIDKIKQLLTGLILSNQQLSDDKYQYVHRIVKLTNDLFAKYDSYMYKKTILVAYLESLNKDGKMTSNYIIKSRNKSE